MLCVFDTTSIFVGKMRILMDKSRGFLSAIGVLGCGKYAKG